MSHADFVHLHLHTEYSMLDGASRIEEVVKAAASDGQPAVGITDHGNMYGVLDFYKECRAQGITPVIGMEAYQAADSRFRRQRSRFLTPLTALPQPTPPPFGELEPTPGNHRLDDRRGAAHRKGVATKHEPAPVVAAPADLSQAAGSNDGSLMQIR